MREINFGKGGKMQHSKYCGRDYLNRVVLAVCLTFFSLHSVSFAEDKISDRKFGIGIPPGSYDAISLKWMFAKNWGTQVIVSYSLSSDKYYRDSSFNFEGRLLRKIATFDSARVFTGVGYGTRRSKYESSYSSSKSGDDVINLFLIGEYFYYKLPQFGLSFEVGTSFTGNYFSDSSSSSYSSMSTYSSLWGIHYYFK